MNFNLDNLFPLVHFLKVDMNVKCMSSADFRSYFLSRHNELLNCKQS